MEGGRPGPRRHICHHYSPGASGAWEPRSSPPKPPPSMLQPVPPRAWDLLCLAGTPVLPLISLTLSHRCSCVLSFPLFLSVYNSVCLHLYKPEQPRWSTILAQQLSSLSGSPVCFDEYISAHSHLFIHCPSDLCIHTFLSGSVLQSHLIVVCNNLTQVKLVH